LLAAIAQQGVSCRHTRHNPGDSKVLLPVRYPESLGSRYLGIAEKVHKMNLDATEGEKW